MLPFSDVAWSELAMLALLVWLFYRYTWLTLAATLMLLGLAALAMLPVDLYFTLPSLVLIGAGLGMLVHGCQQRQATQRRAARTPRTYQPPQSEFRT